MTDVEVIEAAEVIHPGDLVPVQRAPLTVTPEVSARDLVARLDVIRDAMKVAMQPDVDYGVIPGTGGKPTLLKPGSEKLGVLFQLDIQLVNDQVWDGEHLTVTSHATVFHAPTGTRLGSGEGLCSTREAKYAWRQAQRLCPDCGEPQVREGKPRDGKPGNWYCWKKMGGCGVTWALDSPQGLLFKAMETGRMPNPDVADSWNTVLKMAEKRGRVDAVLAVTGASALFTQDIGDDDPGTDTPPVPESRSDGKQPASQAKNLGEWEQRMQALEVEQPKEWLIRACSASGVETKWSACGQRANRVLLHLSDNPPASSLGFWTSAEVQAGFAIGFDGVAVEPPPGPADHIEFGEPAS